MKVRSLFDALPPHRWDRFVQRFNSKILRRGDCLLWTGERNDRGYGRLAVERKPRRHRFYAHRVAYEIACGDSPESLDHTCRNTSCVNWAHLDPCSRAVNTIRQMAAIHGSDPGVECKRGHVGEYRRDPKSGRRYCKGCSRERERRRRNARNASY